MGRIISKVHSALQCHLSARGQVLKAGPPPPLQPRCPPSLGLFCPTVPQLPAHPRASVCPGPPGFHVLLGKPQASPPPRVEDLLLLFTSLAPTPCPFQGPREHPQPPSGSSTREPGHPLRVSHPASHWSIFRHRGYSCVKKQRDRLGGSRPDGSHTRWLWFCDPGPPGHVCEMGTGPLHPGGLEDQMRSRV